MSRPPEQDAADAAVEAAIRQSAQAYGFAADGDFIGDWVVVVETAQLNGDVSGTPYTLLMSGGELSQHRLRGLIAVADEIVDSTWHSTDDN